MKPTLTVQEPLASDRSTLLNDLNALPRVGPRDALEDVSIQCQHQDESQAKATNSVLAQIKLKELCPARARNDTLDAFCSTFRPAASTALPAECVAAPARALLFTMMR